MIPCQWCDRPEDAHPAYGALRGMHDFEPDTAPALSKTPVRESRIVDCDDGPGVTMTWEQVNSQPSARLPRWPDPPPEPTYRTGRVGPLPPVPEESYPPDAVDLPVEYADDLDVIAQSNPSLGRRVEPNVFRRILNATRRSST